MSNHLVNKLYTVRWIKSGKFGAMVSDISVVSEEDLNGRRFEKRVMYLTDRSLTVEDEKGEINSINYFLVEAKSHIVAVDEARSYICERFGKSAL